MAHTRPGALVKPLTPKQQRFVAEYLVDLDATAAAKRVGYSPKSAQSLGCQLLQHPKVSAAVSAGKTKQLSSAALSATRVLEELRRLAFSDARGFWNADGSLKKMADLTDEQGSVLAGFEAIIKNAAAGDGITDTVHKIKLWDKPRALEMLAKHFALLTDVVQVEVGATLAARLTSARQRALTA